MHIDDDVWVTLRYRLFDSQGEAIEPAERELTYLQGGYGAVFARIEQALAGHGVGFATSVYLEPEDSFGDYDADLVRLAPRAEFPDELEVGMTFEGVPGEHEDDEAAAQLFIVTDFTDEAVVLDANHPLAGMALRFDLRVVDLRAATAEEVDRERELAGEYAEGEGEQLPARRWHRLAGEDARRVPDDEPASPDDGPDPRDGAGAPHDPGRRRLH